MASVVLVILAMSLAMAPAPQSFKAETLSGIPNVHIDVELNDEALAKDLNKSRLKADVELMLRTAGIKLSEESNAFLYLNVTIDRVNPEIISGRGFGFVAGIGLDFYQLVIIKENGKTIYAPTGRSSSILYGSLETAENAIKSKVRDLTDKFIHDYFSANSKR